MSAQPDPAASNARRTSLPSSDDTNLSSPPFSRPTSPSAQLNSITVTPAPAPAPESDAAAPAPLQPARKKPGRKPKNAPLEPAVEAKPKRTRKPKDPNAPPVQRKRKAKESLENANRPLEIKFAVDPENVYRGPPPPALEAAQAFKTEAVHSQAPISFFSNPPPPPPPILKPAPQQQPPAQQQPQPAVRTSGQNYDPIRSNYDPVRENVVSYGPYNPGNPQGSPGLSNTANRASASPSISSLVDPSHQSPTTASHSFFIHHQQQQRQHQNQSEHPPSAPDSPTANRPVLAPAEPAPSAPKLRAEATTSAHSLAPQAISKKAMASGSTATSSAAASPKPPKLKDAKDTYPTPPPLPGSGLLQLGGPNDGTEFRAPTVILNIPMNGEANKYVNFTRLAEEQYGWDALHPRAAAQRDRLARVAEVSAALERNGSRESGDEMSLDSEAEGSNAEMGGMSDGRTGTDGGAKKVVRKRKMKEDEYDKDDGFVDDTELLWEEQAAAATDGFFVYSGPLVPEVEKPAADKRADGAPKRGRGRGSRGGSTRASGGRGGAAGTGPRAGQPLTGPGSRGGSTTRKPRITKADRLRMEQEKREREQMGLASNQGYGMPHLASAATLGTTPMVFNQ